MSWINSNEDWRKPYQEMIDQIRDEELGDWEYEFIQNIGARLARNQPLTQKQIEKLEEISGR